jgi:hypothetical protein
MSCAGLLAFAAGGRFPTAASLRASAGPAVRVQPESVRAELRARSLAAVVSRAALFSLLAGSVQRRAVAQGRQGEPKGPARNTDGQR